MCYCACKSNLIGTSCAQHFQAQDTELFRTSVLQHKGHIPVTR